MGGLLDAVGLSPNARRARLVARQLRSPLQSIATQLSRIADALERLSPPLVSPEPNSVTVDDVNLKMQAMLEEIGADLYQKLGRPATEDELLARYSEIEDL
jgi:hypothetical protein